MTDADKERERERTIQSRALWVSLLGSIAIGLAALIQGHTASALVFGTLALASGASLIAVRGRGLPAPVTASSRSGIWQMAFLTIGSALAAIAMLLWGLGVFGTEDPLHVFGFVCAACGGWLTWRGVLNIRRMIEESSAGRP